MAQKQHEMKYVISAQASGFTSAFKEAQATLSSTQQKLMEVTKVQADISAYQKQQQAIDKTKQQLELLEKQYDNYQREMDETGQFSAKLANQQDKAAQKARTTEQTLKQQEQALQQLGQALNEAGVDTENLASESERLKAEEAQLVQEGKDAAQSMGQMEQEAKEAADGLDDMAESAEDAGETSQGFGDKASAAIGAVGAMLASAQIYTKLKEISEAFLECASASGDFQEAMSNVEALSGASESEMTQLTATAKELGATTKFTAEESATAMGYMAMAGWDANQMLSGIDATMALAAASGEDLASVSDIVTDSLTAFGLTASDTAHFADVLAATATSSNTSVGIMGETFKYAAPVAGALGYSIEDVSVAIGLMANAGIKGSNAGTALRNVFNGLLSGVELTGQAFGEVTVSAVQADGTMMDFSTTINTLRGYFDQMTEAERVNNAMAIAGQRGYAGLLSILNATDSDFAKLTNSINDCTGSAQKMADIKLDNLNGQLTLMKSAWDGVKIAIGDSLSPVLENAYEKLSSMMGVVTEFVNEHPALVTGIAAATGAFTLLAGAIAAVGAASLVLAPLGLSLGTVALALGGIAAAAGGIGVVASAIANMGSETEQAAARMQELSGEISTLTVNGDLIDEYRRLTVEMQDSSLSAEELAQKQAELDGVTAQLKNTYPDLLGQLEAGTEAWERQLDVIERTTEAERAVAMMEFTNNASDAIQNLTDLQQAYEDAQEAYDEAQAALDQGLSVDIDTEGTLAHIQQLRDELKKGILSGDIGFDDQEYLDGIEELRAAISELNGTEVQIENLGDVDRALANIASGSLDASGGLTQLSENATAAEQNLAEAGAKLAAAQSSFVGFLDAGLMNMDGLRLISGNAELSLENLGLTVDDVAERVVNGTMDMDTACSRYGVSEEALERAIRARSFAQADAARSDESGAAAMDESTAAAQRSYREQLQLQYAAQLVADEYMDAESAATAFGMSVDNLNAFITEQKTANDQLADAVIAVESGMLSAELAANRFGVSLDDVKVGVFEDALQNLISTYDEVYRAAYDSFSGQFDLWEQVDEVTATSISDLQSALDSQIEYWNNYNSNLQVLQDYGLDTSGIWDHITDGSSDAAAAAQGLVDAINSGDTTAVDNYVSSYESLQEATGAAAETVANTSDEVKQALDDFQTALSDAADGADMSEEFSQAASDTIQGYIEGLGDGSEVSSLLSEHATSWLESFNSALGTHSPSTITDQSGQDTIAGFAQGVDGAAPNGVSSMQNAANSALAAFRALMNASALYGAGQAAIQGAINGINSMIPSLVAAARNAGSQAAAAYKAAQQIHSPSKLFAWFSEMDIKGAIQGLEEHQEEANRAFAAAAESGIEAYQKAGRDMAELSPYGDAVLNYGASSANALANQAMQEISGATQALARPAEVVEAKPFDNGQIVITLAPVFNIQGVSDSDGIREELESYTADELREIALDAVREAAADAVRRGYI